MVSKPNALNRETVREIRLAHLMDGESFNFIARKYGISLACVSRLCRWLSQADTDQDLRYLPRPVHQGGGARPGTEAYMQQKLRHNGPTCRQCIHIDDYGRCSIGFPECLTSNYQEAAKCNAFIYG